jgi:hypothetical protein
VTLRRITKLAVVLALLVAGMVTSAAAQESDPDLYPMIFPIAGDASYVDTFGAPRSGGRTHKGTDIFAAKGTPVVAVAAGTVIRIAIGDLAGRYIVVQHDDGWRSYYIHLDNDTPGTDDGLGGAPAPGIAVGARVAAGDVLDYVGDSGNAEGTSPHLHFELHDDQGRTLNPYAHLRAAQTVEPGAAVQFSRRTAAAAPPGPDVLNTALVGSYDPGGGFSAGIAVHDHTAYLGTWGRPGVCPGTGVRAVDVSDPADPQEITAFATGDEFPGSSTDSVWVGAVETEAFTGDLAVVAVRTCDNTELGRIRSGFRGLALYDVTDPAAPVLLGQITSGDRTQGVHELDVALREDGTVLVAATVMQSALHTDGVLGDVRIIDVTDPAAPVEIADWDLRRDGPQDVVAEMIAASGDEELHAHGVVFAHRGTWLWVSNWDAGVALVDLADPEEPDLMTVTGFDPATEGNAHAVVFDEATGLLIRSDEDLFPNDSKSHVAGWGGQRLYRVAQHGKVTELATFDRRDRLDITPEQEELVRRDGFYTAHEAAIVDGVQYAAWYSGGVRLVDVSDPRDPTEIGYFVPPARTDPTGHWKAPDGSTAFPMVWGVTVSDELIFMSDINSGLWIARFDDGLDETMVGPGPTDWAPIR